MLILPSYRGGRPMRWQTQATIGFAAVQGYASRLPRAFSRWPIVDALGRNVLGPDAAGELRTFLHGTRVTTILVDGVVLYRVRPR